MARGKDLLDLQIGEILGLYRVGWSQVKISKYFKITQGIVSKVIERNSNLSKVNSNHVMCGRKTKLTEHQNVQNSKNVL